MTKTFNAWIKRLDVTRVVLQSVGMQYHKAKNVPKEELVFLDLLKRIKANLGGARDILVDLNELAPTDNFEKKIPLSILLRSCLADCMTGLYLGTFKNPEFSEELDVLNLDFVKYMGSMIPLEVELWNFLSGETNDPQLQLDERYDVFQRWLKSDKGEPWKTKKPAEFRLSDPSRTAKIDFPSIHERLKVESKALAYMYNYYRYYSQYEHFTSIGRDIFNSPFEEEIGTMERALVSIMHSVLLISAVLPKINKELEPLVNELNSIIPQEHLP